MSNFDCTLIFPENGLSVKKNFHNNKSKVNYTSRHDTGVGINANFLIQFIYMVILRLFQQLNLQPIFSFLTPINVDF